MAINSPYATSSRVTGSMKPQAGYGYNPQYGSLLDQYRGASGDQRSMFRQQLNSMPRYVPNSVPQAPGTMAPPLRAPEVTPGGAGSTTGFTSGVTNTNPVAAAESLVPRFDGTATPTPQTTPPATTPQSSVANPEYQKIYNLYKNAKTPQDRQKYRAQLKGIPRTIEQQQQAPTPNYDEMARILFQDPDSADPLKLATEKYWNASGLYERQREEGTKALDRLVGASGLDGSSAEIAANEKFIRNLTAEERQRSMQSATDEIKMRMNIAQQNADRLERMQDSESARKEREAANYWNQMYSMLTLALGQSPMSQAYGGTTQLSDLIGKAGMAAGNALANSYRVGAPHLSPPPQGSVSPPPSGNNQRPNDIFGNYSSSADFFNGVMDFLRLV